jgi:hypothetical protein
MLATKRNHRVDLVDAFACRRQMLRACCISSLVRQRSAARSITLGEHREPPQRLNQLCAGAESAVESASFVGDAGTKYRSQVRPVTGRDEQFDDGQRGHDLGHQPVAGHAGLVHPMSAPRVDDSLVLTRASFLGRAMPHA